MKAMSPLEELRHSTAHVLATAVLRLFPEAKLDIGPPTDSGFYYDFDLDHRFSAEDLQALEKEMKKVVKERQPFERIETSRDEAETFFQEAGQPYKISRLGDIPEDEAVTFYRNGEFTDLCAGTHVPHTGHIKAFKLLSIAGAYHRGDEKNKQLQRIYGTAFPNKKELADYLERLEEAKKRDHRRVGREQKLFTIDEEVGQGMVLWMPNGAVIRQELQNFIMDELFKQNYEQVFTPHVGKLGLYRTSGHFPYYRDSQYPPLVEPDALESMAHEGCSCSDLTNRLNEGDVDGFLLKPMNCPMHIRIYASQPHSYRDLPVRMFEFGTVYRWEQSGELNGMTRVRGFTQDDAHLFCTEDQLKDEIEGCLDLVKTVFRTLGMSDYRVRIGLRDPDSTKYTGPSENWDKAEQALRELARDLDVPYTEEPGEAAFYGPKIDFVVKDVIGREWQLGTVQVDYNLPERFALEYIGSDNKPHRPVMIHRAPFGSMERFVGVLIEHFAGDFPLWLAPEQVRILPLSDKLVPYGQKLLQKLRSRKFRATLDSHDEKLGAKIRRGRLDKIPYLLIVGGREEEAEEVSVRSRAHGEMGTLPFAQLLSQLEEERETRFYRAAQTDEPNNAKK
ncbi:MAG: threonine--tRNA ligase [Opitutales bacterium]|nr:threonine--tRNA ligase [Opitutales bacterium]